MIFFPAKKVLIVSNTAARSEEFSSQVRNLVAEFGHFNNVTLDPKWRSRDKFKTNMGGSLVAVGTLASIAGLGYDYCIVDDPIKSQEEANSFSQREKLALWMSSELLTRQLPHAKTIVVGSRRHQDDITARLLKLNDNIEFPSAQWHEILFPAINEAGEALWPERYPLSKLNEIRANLAEQGMSWVWEALYQQHPINSASSEWGDTLVNDLLLVDQVPTEFVMKTMALDLAISKSEKADNTACIVMGWEADGRGTVIDGFIGKMDICVVEDSVAKLIDIHKPAGILVEKNNFQKMVLDNLILKCPTANLFGYTAKSEKHERIRLLLTPLLHRSQFHIKKCQMGRMILSEMQQFPHGAHDDSLDAISYAIGIYNMISGISEEILPNLTYL